MSLNDHLEFTRQEGDLTEAKPADLAQPDSLALARALLRQSEVIECPEDDEDAGPCCQDCPIGNRAPEHADHDPTRGPCPRAGVCDAEGREFVEAMQAEFGRSLWLECTQCERLCHVRLSPGVTELSGPFVCPPCAKKGGGE